MNRNVESHFAELPSVDVERSIFDRSHTHKTSWNVGELVVFYWDEVLPGDTFNVTTSFVARLQTLLTPIMDNVYLDTYYFFVPARLTWTHWKEFMGENTASAWIPETTYTVPKIKSPENGWNIGTIADYMGIPVGVDFSTEDGTDKLAPDALPIRAYALICNEWFRDQNLSDPLNIPLGDSTQTGSNGSNYINDVANGGKPFVAAKFHDYFTSCLPSPQKGTSVTFGANPIATISGDLPVYQKDDLINTTKYGSKKTKILNAYTGSYFSTNRPLMTVAENDGDDNYWSSIAQTNGTATFTADSDITIANLWADAASANLNVSGVSFTINELRLAFQLQKFYEKWARAGSRYRETLKVMFGVTSPDARMMVPEYLGGHRVPIQIHQITNQASSSGEYLGDVGAMSNTADVHEDFVKSFTEHGFVIGVCCVRYDHSYPQGLSRMWTHDDRFSYYWPVFANIGEQPVYKYEIDAGEYVNKPRTNVFGYQEAWANYRYMPDRVSGEMRPGISNSLASWHLSDYYTDQPSLSDSWIREDKANVDRVLAVSSTVSHQIFADFYIKNIVTRAMPLYSIPGLIDHH